MTEEVLFGKGEKNLFNEYFTGQNYINILAIFNEVMVLNLTFDPGCRTKKHIIRTDKNGGIIGLVTGGEGWYKEEGQDARKLKQGDALAIPTNVKHWGGATKDSSLSMLIIEVPGENQNIEWCEEVSDDEYNALE